MDYTARIVKAFGLLGTTHIGLFDANVLHDDDCPLCNYGMECQCTPDITVTLKNGEAYDVDSDGVPTKRSNPVENN